MKSWHFGAVKVIRMINHGLYCNVDLYEILHQPGWFTILRTLAITCPLRALKNRHPKGTVNLRWRVRCMVVLVCGSQHLEELRHLRLQDNQV